MNSERTIRVDTGLDAEMEGGLDYIKSAGAGGVQLQLKEDMLDRRSVVQFEVPFSYDSVCTT